MPTGRTQQFTTFAWTPARAQAAELLADDALSDEEIASTVGVTRRALAKWKLRPEFQARIEERRAAQRQAIEAEGVANKQNRIARYQQRWERLHQIIEERALALAGHTAGGSTGLLVRQAKVVKVYETDSDPADQADPDRDETLTPVKRAQVVYEYPLDAALLRELRALEEQVAKELGQWTEKSEQTLDATDRFVAAMIEWGARGQRH